MSIPVGIATQAHTAIDRIFNMICAFFYGIQRPSAVT
jgi:hypothetical protein